MSAHGSLVARLSLDTNSTGAVCLIRGTSSQRAVPDWHVPSRGYGRSFVLGSCGDGLRSGAPPVAGARQGLLEYLKLIGCKTFDQA
jgi:hypothetical protein